MSPRDAFLQNVRAAVKAGNRAGTTPPLPECGQVGYQGAGADPVERFCAELTAVGGHAHVVADPAAAWRVIAEIAHARQVRKVVAGCGGLLERLDIVGQLRAAGIEVATVDALPMPREVFFEADLGVSNVYRLIAETGTVAVASWPEEPRSLSLLPPVHIAVAERAQLVPDLFDLFAQLAGTPPACLSLITGPSKTGDIELRLVTGVHGPGEVHVVVCV
jgi:L-lactate dehydrogenase complex protein LldG